MLHFHITYFIQLKIYLLFGHGSCRWSISWRSRAYWHIIEFFTRKYFNILTLVIVTCSIDWFMIIMPIIAVIFKTLRHGIYLKIFNSKRSCSNLSCGFHDFFLPKHKNWDFSSWIRARFVKLDDMLPVYMCRNWNYSTGCERSSV